MTTIRPGAPNADDDARHGGSGNLYSNHGCRCPLCTEAHRQRVRRRVIERYEETERNGGIAPVSVHGAYTYSNWGCRCAVCSDGNRRRVQRFRNARRREGEVSS